MTKRDVVDAAGLLSVSLNVNAITLNDAAVVAKFLMVYFKDKVPNFNAEHFLKACGLEIVR